MIGDATTGPPEQLDAAAPAASPGMDLFSMARHAALLALCGTLLIALLYQIPVQHLVDIGGYDSGYALGFHDPERLVAPGARPYLQGSDGSARWTRGESYIIFPQAGLPAELTVRLRGRPAPSQPASVTLLVNGIEATRFDLGSDWETHTVPVFGGLAKPEDVLLSIRAEAVELGDGDTRRVGVLVDQVSYRAGPPPILPYPSQLIYAAIAAGLLALLISPMAAHSTARLPGHWPVIAALILIGLAFILLYRMQPLYPLPVRGLLPGICLGLGAALAIRHAHMLHRSARLPVFLGWTAIAIWTGFLLWQSQQHLVLSVPGVEKDFRVFATRLTLPEIFKADGFYNLGYPLLLWLVRPFVADSPFLAARLIAALSGALLLAATWRMASRWLGPGSALPGLAALALSPLTVEYSLYVGSDMPFAALCAIVLMLLTSTTEPQNRRAAELLGQGSQEHRAAEPLNCRTAEPEEPRTKNPEPHIDERRGAATAQNTNIQPPATSHQPPAGQWSWRLFGAGLVAGAAFLVRHPGIALLFVGWISIWIMHRSSSGAPAFSFHRRQSSIVHRPSSGRPAIAHLAIFTLGFVLAIAPQLFVNLRDTGSPFYSQQSKNIWLAVFGNGDWGRWGEASNDVSLGEVILQDPGRFAANFIGNLEAFAGTGAEDTSEFGRAIQLRLLGFPASWLAVAGLIGWVWMLLRPASNLLFPISNLSVTLLLWLLLYVAAVSVGFTLPRFFLVLVPVYAIACAWAIQQIARRLGGLRAHLALGLGLVVLLWGGFGTGAAYVLRPAEPGESLPGQTADTLEVARMALALLAPQERALVRVSADDEPGLALAKYSAIADRLVSAPGDDPEAIKSAGADLLIWSERLGPAPDVGPQIGRSGPYLLYRITP